MSGIKTVRTALIVVAAVCAVGVNPAEAKSVYAITEHYVSTFKAYKIQGDQLEHQKTENMPYGIGAVDVAIDDELARLFITYEAELDYPAQIIVWANAKSLQEEGLIDLSDVMLYGTQLAGIVMDEEKHRVYTVERGNDKLYILSWDSDRKELVLMDPDDPSQPYTKGQAYVELAYLGGQLAHGLALDGNLLYVTNNTNEVHYYNTETNNHIWSPAGTPRDVGRWATDITIDPNNGEHPAYLYAGGYTSHTHLIKHNLSSGSTDSFNAGAGVIGLGVDPDSGLVYTTTSDKELRVYDFSDPCSVTCTYSDNLGGQSAGCGVCVPTADISYKPTPDGLTFYKEEQIENENSCLDPNDPNSDNVTYTIHYGNPITNENDPDYIGTMTNVVITDWLPGYISREPNDVVASEPNVIYDDSLNKLTWDIGTLNPGDSNSVTATVKITKRAEPAIDVTNDAEIESDNYYKKHSLDTDVCCWGGNIIYVDWSADGYNTGTSWQDAYTDLQDALARADRGCGSEIWVAKGVYKPGASRGDSFVLTDDLAMYGGFAGGETSLGQRNYVQNKTILSGDIDPDGSDDTFYVIKAYDLNLLVVVDGFIVKDAASGGAFCSDSDVTFKNCIIKDNKYRGIYASSNVGSTITVCYRG